MPRRRAKPRVNKPLSRDVLKQVEKLERKRRGKERSPPTLEQLIEQLASLDAGNFLPREASAPTGARPGTPEKERVFQERIARGEKLFHPHDWPNSERREASDERRERSLFDVSDIATNDDDVPAEWLHAAPGLAPRPSPLTPHPEAA